MRRFAAILVLLAGSLCATAGFGDTYYFARTGNDANTGADWQNAKLNLQGFVQNLTNSVNTIYVGAGEWQMTNSYFAIPKNQKIVGTNRETVFRGTGTNPVIYIVNQTNVWLEGLTITGGSNAASGAPFFAGYGGGVSAGSTALGTYSDQVVTNCSIVSNGAHSYGGGISAIGVLVDSEVAYNVAPNGAGIRLVAAGSGLSIHHNYATLDGGGIYSGTLRNCELFNNVSRRGGGGFAISIYDSSVVSNVAFSIDGGGLYGSYGTNLYVAHNRAPVNGGISGVSYTNVVVFGNHATNGAGGGGNFNACCGQVVSNSATGAGGGAQAGTFYRVLFQANSASYGGGASGSKLYSCVVASNSSSSYSPAIDLNNAATLAYNCTVVGHTSNVGAIRIVNGGNLANSIVYGNKSNAPQIVNYGTVVTNNFTNDPAFIAGTYMIGPGSPCIDAGDSALVPAGMTNDFYGRPRISGLAVDVGAAEHTSGVDVPEAVVSVRNVREVRRALPGPRT